MDYKDKEVVSSKTKEIYNVQKKDPIKLTLKINYNMFLKILDKVLKAVLVKNKNPRHLWQFINTKLERIKRRKIYQY